MAWKGDSFIFYCIHYELWLFQVPPDESSLSAYDDTSSVELNNAGSERETGTSSSSGRTSAVDSNTSYYNNWAFLKVKDYGVLRSTILVLTLSDAHHSVLFGLLSCDAVFLHISLCLHASPPLHTSPACSLSLPPYLPTYLPICFSLSPCLLVCVPPLSLNYFTNYHETQYDYWGIGDYP